MILRDSIDAPLIPTDTPVVAGYGDGKFIWSPSWRDGSNWFDLFPSSVKLVIVVSAAHIGDILDVETGDATPAEAPGWCKAFNRTGRRAPTIYCNRETWPLVIDAMRTQGVDPLAVDWWISTLDGTVDVTVPAGGKEPALVQVIDTGSYDESVILDLTWAGEELMVLMKDWEEPALIMAFQLIQTSMFGVIDPTGQSSFVTAIRNGTPVNAIMDGWRGLPQAIAFQSQLANLANLGAQVNTLQAEVDALKATPPAGFIPHSHTTDKGTVS